MALLQHRVCVEERTRQRRRRVDEGLRPACLALFLQRLNHAPSAELGHVVPEISVAVKDSDECGARVSAKGPYAARGVLITLRSNRAVC